VPPRVLELPAGTFHGFMRDTPGEPRRVPRVSGDRDVADGLLAALAARGREPLLAVGS
jgi:hypothetical protein